MTTDRLIKDSLYSSTELASGLVGRAVRKYSHHTVLGEFTARMGSQHLRIRDLGYTPGVLPTGPANSILDVPGVHISQVTVPTKSDLPSNSTATKGLTVISPRPPREFYKPCRASTFCFNGNGELTCSRQIADWGFTNTPIAFTNSLSLGTVFDGIWDWVLETQDELGWDGLTRARHYGTPVVGETADWIVNSDVRSSRLDKNDIKHCLKNLRSKEDGGTVLEGQAGGGAGMTCHQFAGGTGTSSRLIAADHDKQEHYTVGALCQTNYGHLHDLVIGGVPVGRLLQKENTTREASADDAADMHAPAGSQQYAGRTKDGSILVLLITDAPLATHQLNRIARHATVGLTQVGGYGVGRTFSGDIFLALSVAEHGPEQLEGIALGAPITRPTQTYESSTVKNECIDSYFYACAEAVEEAILNSMCGGRHGTVAMDGTAVEGLPVDRVRELLSRHMVKV